jgi:hypothetical protein
MLRATDLPGAQELSLTGGLVLLAFAAKAFWDRTREQTYAAPRLAPVRREVPFLSKADARVAPGTQRAS